MEDNKKGGNSMPQQQDNKPQFKTADIHKTKAGQSDDLKMNVHETRVNKIKKSNAKIGEWLHHHHKHILILVVSISVVAVGVFMGVCVVPKLISDKQQENEPQQVAAEEDLGRPSNSGYDDVLDETDRIYANNPDNAPRVVAYYQELINEANIKSDFGRTYALLKLEVAFFERKGLLHAAIDALADARQATDAKEVKSYCTCELHRLANETGDDQLKSQYTITATDDQSRGVLGACEYLH